MKKALALILALALSMSMLAACGGGSEEPAEGGEAEAQTYDLRLATLQGAQLADLLRENGTRVEFIDLEALGEEADG